MVSRRISTAFYLNINKPANLASNAQGSLQKK